MWRRTYLFFVLVRLYFALSSSYLHPDENFQGPEIIAGRVFSYPIHKTWEFTSENPIRSAFPLWPIYGLPMLILRWLWEGTGRPEVAPSVVYWTLRTLMFFLSFVLEDWAIHELFDSPQRRRVAIMLIASSYVTWTWQTHTFSNSIETLVLVWTLVLVKRVVETPRQRSPLLAPTVLAILLVFGVFNRVTFVAYAFAPMLELLPHLWIEPSSIVIMLFFGILTTIAAITVDTTFYTEGRTTFRRLVHHPVVTPWNSLRYNTQASNLALHGSHPFYQHILINLPQLLGPAYLLFLTTSWWKSTTFRTAICGIAILSFIPHQEARFLLPAIPLILASIRVPSQYTKPFIAVWLIFNVLLGILMGIYHQGGIVPMQTWLSEQNDVAKVLWWKTYSAPIWLLNGRNENLTTIDLMGMNKDLLQDKLCEDFIPFDSGSTVLVAPRSATYLDQFCKQDADKQPEQAPQVHLEELWSYRNHLNLDDLDFGDDGVWSTLSRVVGRRGLVAWRVVCNSPSQLDGRFMRDW